MTLAPRLAALFLLLFAAGLARAQSEAPPPPPTPASPAASAASAPEPALPASAPEPAASAPATPPPPSCGALTTKANAADLRAATALAQNKPLDEQVRLYRRGARALDQGRQHLRWPRP